MNLAKLSISLLILSITLPSVVNAADLETSVENLSLDTLGIEQLVVKSTSGFLKIKGDPSLSSIEVNADLLVDKSSYRLTLSKDGNKAILIAEANTRNTSFWFGDSPKIDLTIKLPQKLALDIDDGSGFIEVSHINGHVAMDDGSGSINISHLANGLTLNDGSGSIDIESVQGNVVIQDGSGGINLTKVIGAVKIDDGSGAMVLTEIQGDVELEDGSGHIKVSGVDGQVTIDDGSGDIKVNDVTKGLTIINAGSGGLTMKNVKGDIVTH